MAVPKKKEHQKAKGKNRNVVRHFKLEVPGIWMRVLTVVKLKKSHHVCARHVAIYDGKEVSKQREA